MAVTLMSVITWCMASGCVRTGSRAATSIARSKVRVPIGRGSLNSRRRRALGVTNGVNRTLHRCWIRR